MISLEKCEAYLNEYQAQGAERKLTLGVCHGWLALSDAVRKYETIVGEEDGSPSALEAR